MHLLHCHSRVSDSPVSAENVIYEAFVVMGELGWAYSAFHAWKKGKVETCPFFIFPSFSTHSLSTWKSMKRSTTLLPPSKRRLNKSQFLPKLSSQKPHWDQARLSSLVNKQVDIKPFPYFSKLPFRPCTASYQPTPSALQKLIL